MRPLVICCSQRFKEELEIFERFLRKREVPLFVPNFRRHRKRSIYQPEYLRLRSVSYKAKVPGLVWAHFNNLEIVHSMGGMCLVYNPEAGSGQSKDNGYIGSNTQGEIGFCAALKMPLIMLKPHQEEWIMTIAHKNDKNRIFTLKHPKSDPSDLDAVWPWLGGHLQ